MNRRDQIVAEAIELMASGGIQNLTIKNLAAAIGVSEPALYRHFKNKQAILLGVLDQFEMISCDVFDQMEPHLPALSQLRQFIFDRFERFLAYPSLAQIMFAGPAFEFDPELSARLLQIMRIHRDRLLKIIIQGQKEGALRSDIAAPQLFRIVIGPTRLIIQQWLMSDQRFDLNHEGEQLWKALEQLLINPNGETK